MQYSYEVVRYDENTPAMILMQDKPGWRSRTKLHWHKEIELLYMIDGYIDVVKNGKRTRLSNNGLWLCNSEEMHIVEVDDDNRNNRYLVLLLSYDFAKCFCKTLDYSYFDLSQSETAREKIKEAMRNLVFLTEHSGGDEYVDIKRDIEIYKIYYALLSDCLVSKKNANGIDKVSNNSGSRYAKTVIDYIDKNFREDITLNDMASLVGLSPTYFSKYFKNITESSFTTYLNSVRLEHALRDMLNRGLPVGEAAAENGFPNVKSFITMCKKVYNCTPAQYKKKITQ